MFLNHKNINFILLFFILSIIIFVNCVPQSVLINKKESSRLQTNKDKRAPFNENLNQKDQVIDIKVKEINDDESNTIGHDVISEKLKLIPQKRGVNNQYFTDRNTLLENLPYGFWGDNDNSLMYPDIQGLQEPSIYNNGEQLFTDLMPLQIGIPSAYYNDKRRKRSNSKMNKKLSMHPISYRQENSQHYDPWSKRNSKLTPSIVTAIAQAGMQARANPELYKDIFGPVKTAELIAATQLLLPYGLGPASLQNFDEFGEWASYWIEPTVDNIPYNFQYDDNDYNFGYDTKGNRGYPAKRFMVAKKNLNNVGGFGSSTFNNNNNDYHYGKERFFSEPIMSPEIPTIPENAKYYSLSDSFAPLRRAPRI